MKLWREGEYQLWAEEALGQALSHFAADEMHDLSHPTERSEAVAAFKVWVEERLREIEPVRR